MTTQIGLNKAEAVSFSISSKTKYILSTSGRLSSLQRYQRLLQDILELDIAYLPFHTGDSSQSIIDPQRFASALKGLPCIGGAISKDIKHGIIPFLDQLDETANSVQSVNTVIVTSDQKLIGYNTDVLGFRSAIEHGIHQSGQAIKTAVCYGYGGVASVVVSVLQGLNIRVYMCGRNLLAAAERAKALNCEVWDDSIQVDLFVNATPASEKPLEEATNFLAAIRGAKMVFDHEMPGKYLQEYCQARGSEIYYIKGTDMYYPQMAAQWSLFLDGLIDTVRITEFLQLAENK